MELIFMLLALIAGACAPIQAGINSQLRYATGDPLLAALISFSVGTLALAAYSIAARVQLPPTRTFLDLPLWLWTGGVLGAFLVAVSIILVPKLGAATLMALMITGQMSLSVVLDHFGLIGYTLHPISGWRLVGVVMLVTGVVIIKRF